MFNSGSNLVIITLDQCRADWLNPTNNICRISTINEIARKSLVVENCYTASPHCVPARMSWLTGRDPIELGITQNCRVDATTATSSIFKSLQRMGWHTELVGKTHWTNHYEAYDLKNNKVLMTELGFNRTLEIAGPRALQRIECSLTEEWKKRNYWSDYRIDM